MIFTLFFVVMFKRFFVSIIKGKYEKQKKIKKNISFLGRHFTFEGQVSIP